MKNLSLTGIQGFKVELQLNASDNKPFETIVGQATNNGGKKLMYEFLE